LLRSLLAVAGAVLLLMTWIHDHRIFQLGDLIARLSAIRTHGPVYAAIDLIVNCCAVFIQLFGTGRFIARFGVGAGFANLIIMVIAPGNCVLTGIDVARRYPNIRRVAGYAVAKPTRRYSLPW
jgi:hypothetical protein